jgi:hypothetical protein
MNIEAVFIPRDNMQKNNAKRDPVPDQFASIEEAAAFWETHDLTVYEDIWREVDFKVNLGSTRVELEPKIAQEFAKRARAKKMRLDTFVNRVLKDYLQHAA